MKKKRPPLSELIGKTTGANRRDEARAFLDMRRREILGADSKASPPPDVPEAVPVIDDPDRYGQDFWQRFIEKQGLAKPEPKKPTKKKPGRPSKTPSPFRVIDGKEPEKP